MTLSRPGKPAQSSSSTIALIECSVKVSPTLARLIRKSAEKEMSGASAKDALLTAAGVQPGEVATLQRKLQQASENPSDGARKPLVNTVNLNSQKSRLLSATTRGRLFSMTLVRRLPHLKGHSSKSSRSKHG